MAIKHTKTAIPDVDKVDCIDWNADHTAEEDPVFTAWDKDHADLTNVTSDQHHAQSHNIASHSDTTATGAELNTLTDNSIANTLHRHSELVASDGSPDPALSVDAVGNTTAVGQVSITGASRVRVTKDNAQSFGNGALTKVQYDDETFDNLNEYDNTVNYRFTATKAGYYRVDAALRIQPQYQWIARRYYQLLLYKNGAQYSRLFWHQSWNTITTYYPSLHGSDIVYLAAGEYVEIYFHHNQGGTVASEASALSNFFSVHRLS